MLINGIKVNLDLFIYLSFIFVLLFVLLFILSINFAVSQITPNNERIQEIPHLVHNHGYLFTFYPAKKVNNFLFYIFIFC